MTRGNVVVSPAEIAVPIPKIILKLKKMLEARVYVAVVASSHHSTIPSLAKKNVVSSRVHILFDYYCNFQR